MGRRSDKHRYLWLSVSLTCAQGQAPACRGHQRRRCGQTRRLFRKPAVRGALPL